MIPTQRSIATGTKDINEDTYAITVSACDGNQSWHHEELLMCVTSTMVMCECKEHVKSASWQLWYLCFLS